MQQTEKFDFNDILIVPEIITEIKSRYKGIELPIALPLFTAPMDTVVNLSNIDEFIDNNIMVCLPRTVTLEDFQYFLFENKDRAKYENVFLSFGFNEINDLIDDIENGISLGCKFNILIDVANGHMKMIVNFVNLIKRRRPDIIIMVGNIANPATFAYYINECNVDYIRVGIGNGGGCLTTKNSAIGYPMASLIEEITVLKKKYEFENCYSIKRAKTKIIPKIVADGGMKDYSDIIKAFALGADYVMVGSIFNKAIESAGTNYLGRIRVGKWLGKFLYSKGFKILKHFRGMSTKGAQKAMGKTNLKTSEGITRYRPVEYTLAGWVRNFDHYLRNAMSYTGCRKLDEFIGYVDIIKITNNAYDFIKNNK